MAAANPPAIVIEIEIDPLMGSGKKFAPTTAIIPTEAIAIGFGT